MRPQLTPRAQKQLEESFKLEREAIQLLDVIVAEFESDPMSVQCFDLRIVERAKHVVKRLRQIDKDGPFGFTRLPEPSPSPSDKGVGG